jgi:hypothetical protein
MTVLLHPIAGKYLDRLGEPNKGRVKAALGGMEKEPLRYPYRPARAIIHQKKQREEKMTATFLRKELHTMIDTMPDRFIQAMVPLVSCITEEYWKPVIEPASPEETAMINERMKDYEKDPDSFVTLESIH